jgi:hypothetical protein
MPKQTMEQTERRYCGPGRGRFVQGICKGQLFEDVYRTKRWYFASLHKNALHSDYDEAKSYYRIRQSQATGRRSQYF